MCFLSPDLKFPTEICHYFLIFFFNTQSNRKESYFENKEDDTLFL